MNRLSKRANAKRYYEREREREGNKYTTSGMLTNGHIDFGTKKIYIIYSGAYV